jgi:hypothetical protein
MADFKETQKIYSEAVKGFRIASNNLYQARQHLLLLENKIADVLKTGLLTALPAGHALATQRNAAIKKLNETESALTLADNLLATARSAFNALGTASETIHNLSDSFPLVLLPLRLQTRYLTIKHVARNCPDDVLINFQQLNDSAKRSVSMIFPSLKFKEDPLASKSSQAFTLSNVQSGHAQRTIKILNSQVPGRINAVDIKRWRKEDDRFELWIRIFPDDIYLNSHEPALTELEMVAAKKFWQKMWDAERSFRLTNPSTETAVTTRNGLQLDAWKQLRQECLAHRAAWIGRCMKPVDYPDNLQLTTIKIPDAQFPKPGLRSDTWTTPPYTDLLPEHFIASIFFNDPAHGTREVAGAPIPDYLQMGFDPDEKNDASFADKNRVLELPAEIKWLTDPEEAEKVGMAIRIPLSKAEMNSGISKLVVVGVKTGSDPAAAAAGLTRLFENHHYKPDGLSFLPHGTATNNLPGQSSGFNPSRLTDEQSFRNEFPVNPGKDPDTDGRRLTHALGLEKDAFFTIANQNQKDGHEALLLNRSLWSGTLGYYLDNHLRPNITDADIRFTREFFQNYVTGRGLLPSFRAGRQPYGIVPSTAWSAWKPDSTASAEEKRLIRFLKKLDEQWSKLIGKVKTMKTVFDGANSDQVKKDFRELLSYQASSTRYFRRLVAGEYLLWNTDKAATPIGVDKSGIRTTPREFKVKLESVEGWNEPVHPRPQILGKFFDDDNYKLTDLPQDTLDTAAAPSPDTGHNYLSLLLDATFEQLRKNSYGENFGKFVTQRSSTLMFHIARFALLQEWTLAATEILRKEKPSISPLARLDFELEYTVQGTAISHEHRALLSACGFTGNFETRKNKWDFFDAILTNGTSVAHTISQKLKTELSADDPSKSLQNTLTSLAGLTDLPVSDLERLFSEHIDLCSFRLDAWLQGLALARLFNNRSKAGAEKGIFIGGFGYIENLRPGKDRWVRIVEIKEPTVVSVRQEAPDRLVMPVFDYAGFTAAQIRQVNKFVFVYLGSDPDTFLVEDPVSKKIVQSPSAAIADDAGYILTPSLEHAATAGILRSGYEHHSVSQGPESRTLSVNLNSGRTGGAMEMLKAIAGGHSLNEQLGYFIERKMYDDASLAQFIPLLRQSFPLHIERNEWDDDQQINEKEKIINLALVTDGLAIIDKNQSAAGSPSWAQKMTEVFGNNTLAINSFLKITLLAIDQFDAVSDLVLAESVYQMVKGSPERAAAALRMVSEGSNISLPEVANVPVEHRILKHRVGFVLNDIGNPENAWPTGTSVFSVLTRFSPKLNRWLADQLPAPQKIVVRVLTSGNQKLKVGILSTGLQAIDFFYLLRKSGDDPGNSLLSWFLTEAAKKLPGINPENISGISFDRDAQFSPAEISVKELLPQVKTIALMLEQSRPMQPDDFRLTPKDSVEDLFDNTSFKSLCAELTDSSPSGQINKYLAELDAAKLQLEGNPPVGFGSTESDLAFNALFKLIPKAYFLGVWDALPRCPPICDVQNTRILLDHAGELKERLIRCKEESHSAFLEINAEPSLTGKNLFDKLSVIARQFCGEDILLLPRFRLPDQPGLKSTITDTTLASGIGEFVLDEWVLGLSLVRDKIRRYQLNSNLRAAFETMAASRSFKIMQLPFIPGKVNNWIGAEFPEGFIPPDQVTSMAYECSIPLQLSQTISGIMLDEWTEKVPIQQVKTGVSINYDQTNAEAPQCLLLVVPAEMKGTWDWPSVVNAVLDTMTLAKKRAVDSDLIQNTWMSQFLPAIVTPVDAKNNTPGLDFKSAGPQIKPIIPGGPVVAGPTTGTVVTR